MPQYHTELDIKADQVSLSKKIMIYCSVLYGLTWFIMALSWFLFREIPTEIKEYTTYVYSIAIAVYFGKTAYENGKKQVACDTINNILAKERKKHPLAMPEGGA